MSERKVADPFPSAGAPRRSVGRWALLAGALIVLTLLVVPTVFGIGPIAQETRNSPSAPSAPSPPPNSTAGFPTPIRHVVVVMMENARERSVLANGSFERYLAAHYATAGQFYALCHPSAPNYLGLTSGATEQCGSDAMAKYPTENLGDLAQSAGLSWGGFMESMPTPCDRSDALPYVAHHNPFVYYSDLLDNGSVCAQHDVPLTNWTADVTAGAVPTFAFISPNMTDDGHDTGVAVGDAWLRGFLTPIVNDSFFASTVVFVTYDESAANDATGYNGTKGGQVYLAAVSPFARAGFNLTSNTSDYNLLGTIEWLLGLNSTGQNDSRSLWPPMESLFSFPNTTGPLRVAANASPLTGPPPLNVSFTENVSGGQPPYQSSWQFGDGTAGSGTIPSHTYASAGNYTANVTVTDSAGGSATGSVVVRIVTSLVLSAFVVRPPIVDLGSPVNISVTYAGGLPPYQVSFTGLPTGCNGSRPSFNCTPQLEGNYSVTVFVQDAQGAQREANATLGVVHGLAANFSLNRTAIDVGIPFAAHAWAGGGLPPYRFSWSGLPSDCPAPTGPNLTCGSHQAGTYPLSVEVTDATGNFSVYGPVAVRIAPRLNVTTSATPAGGAAPLQAELVANVSGGTAPYSYLWQVGGVMVAGSDPAYVDLNTTGNLTISVTATDAAGAASSNSTIVAVAAPLSSVVQCSPSNVTAGAGTTVAAIPQGGALPFVYEWFLNGSAWPVGSRASFPFVPRAGGEFNFSVMITDRYGQVAQSNQTLVANAVPTPAAGAPPSLSTAIVAVVLVLGVVAVLGVRAWRRRRIPPGRQR